MSQPQDFAAIYNQVRDDLHAAVDKFLAVFAGQHGYTPEAAPSVASTHPSGGADQISGLQVQHNIGSIAQ
jgi:hypothetical protein